MASRDREWEDLYDRLYRALAEFGKDHPSGEGDYWIVDDDYGGQHHKICVNNEGFWSPQIEKRVRDILVEGFPHWGVFVVFEKGPARPGIIVYADGNVIEPGEPRWR